MVVLEDADVVVRESQGVSRSGEERVASPGVLEVVDQGAKKQGYHLDVLQVLPQVTHLGNGLCIPRVHTLLLLWFISPRSESGDL